MSKVCVLLLSFFDIQTNHPDGRSVPPLIVYQRFGAGLN